ncbi:ABC transporter substrate-binding protein [Zhihengliuella sp. ISTPL4]|uniref:ABC transporter substrate-binding protein n=1 Tax=Zhihengliuella sp. ISTPL4 TaxID=2058657 RepID=UPI00130539F8|nr:ABC transporter substrate-binding protein [Zhihengliuella sp. ISTPL4]
MKRIVTTSVATAVAVLVLAGCSSGAPDAAEPVDGPISVSLLTTYNGLPFYTAMQCGAEDAADELGGDITISVDGPSRGMNAADQIPVLEGVVNRGPDGIIFVPADPVAMQAPLQSAVNAGIQVVTTDATLDTEIALAQFHGDNEAGGKLAADRLIEVAGDRAGKVLVLDNRPGLPITNERADGFIDALSAADTDLEILEVQYFEDDPTKAATIVQSSLEANPDIVGIFATSEAGATGTVSGLQGTGADDVSVIAYDAGPTLVDALRAGQLDALVAQGSYTQGYDALIALVRSIRGEEKPEQFDNIVDNALVTADNVDDPEIAKLLYPDSCS